MNQVVSTLFCGFNLSSVSTLSKFVKSRLNKAMTFSLICSALISPIAKAEFRKSVPQPSFGASTPFTGLLAAYCLPVRPNLLSKPNIQLEPEFVEVHLMLIEENQMKFTKTLKMAATAGALLMSSMSFAQAINIGTNDLAIKGYDPVAYFTQNQAIEGSAKFTATHEGAIYRFSNASNRDLFKANADKYAPQFGGYCAMGVALNKKLDVDPSAFYIKDHKLYLNLNKDVQKKWLTDIPGHLKTADRIWRGIEDLTIAQANAED
ncbi:YHS domain-containing (seleno)protein [Neptuniibacter sp. QD29_5]|uniref:YHS domain-containing (seleno)protein n=2 Tax=Neptuniibacter TaxID=459520 RepID=UPI0039F52DF8